MGAHEDQLAALEDMGRDALHVLWTRLTGTRPPMISNKLLRLALAWQIQASVHGGLPRPVQQKLAQMSKGKTTTSVAQPGMRLVREWNGKAHVVVVGEDGVIRWNGKDWRSLSEVARAITGTRWSGPAFFGLKKKLAA